LTWIKLPAKATTNRLCGAKIEAVRQTVLHCNIGHSYWRGAMPQRPAEVRKTANSRANGQGRPATAALACRPELD
jgi:hypothetical protein